MERTYIMIKPDAVARGLVGRIVSRFEDAGLAIERMEYGVVTPEQAAANYAEHEGKPFYPGLVEYIIGLAMQGLLLHDVMVRKLVQHPITQRRRLGRTRLRPTEQLDSARGSR